MSSLTLQQGLRPGQRSCPEGVLTFRCRDRSALQEEEEQDEEEVTGSLLRGHVASSQGEEEARPPLLPVSQRLQSTLHCINLSVRQVGGSRETVLQQLSQQIPDQQSVCLSVQGKLLGVCGSVGSGKTSLISAILGQVRLLPVSGTSAGCTNTVKCCVVCWQMTVLGGSVAVRGRLAYVSQQAWILNATLRDNILFGQEYQEDR